MYRTTGIYDHPTRPAGEPDAWSDATPGWRRHEPQDAYAPPARGYSPAERRRTESTVQEFHTLARAIEEQRGRSRQPEPARTMRAEPAPRRPAPARAPAASERYRPSSEVRSHNNVTWLPQATEPPRGQPPQTSTSRFAAAHEAREMRRHGWDAQEVVRYAEPPTHAAAGRGRRYSAPAEASAAPRAPTARSHYDQRPPAHESELRRLEAMLAELEERVRVLEQGRQVRTRTRRVVSEPAPTSSHSAAAAGAPRRLWG